MATSPALIETFVAMTGESKASVSVTLSRLRKASLIPVGGRGPYAIRMDTEAAMRLLIAICASIPLEADSAIKAVERFEGLLSRPPKVAPEDSEQSAESIIMSIDELPDEHTVGAALKRIIEAGGRSELFTYVDANTGRRRKAFKRPDLRGYLKVHFMLPIPQVRIEHQFSGWLRKTWIYGGQAIDFESYNSACRSVGLGDCARLITISEATIEELGKTLLS
jgi:hypothetical protein